MRPSVLTGNHARLTAVTGGVEFASTYDAAMVAVFKVRIPYDARRWDNVRKVWLVQPEYAKVCKELAQTYLGIDLEVPKHVAAAHPETRLVEMLYLARCKDRDGSSTALGWSHGSWTLTFPESVLRDWFQVGPTEKGQPSTLYGVLGIASTVDVDAVRSAYRRMARHTHPDVNKEPDAAAAFKRVQAAYAILSDPMRRRKYDAGLAFEANVGTGKKDYDALDNYGYRAPLRCGMLLCEGLDTLGRFVVKKIVQWEAITNDQGLEMVTSWPAGAETFTVAWV